MSIDIGSNRAIKYLRDKWEFTPRSKHPTAVGDIYIGEGWQTKRLADENGKYVDYGPGWIVVWAVNRRGPCVARGLFLPSTATPEQRERTAVEDAMISLGLPINDGEAQEH